MKTKSLEQLVPRVSPEQLVPAEMSERRGVVVGGGLSRAYTPSEVEGKSRERMKT